MYPHLPPWEPCSPSISVFPPCTSGHSPWVECSVPQSVSRSWSVIAGRGSSTLTLILAGVAVSSLAGALTSLALNLAPNPFAAVEIIFWLLGSLANRSMEHVWLAGPFMLIGIALVITVGKASGCTVARRGHGIDTRCQCPQGSHADHRRCNRRSRCRHGSRRRDRICRTCRSTPATPSCRASPQSVAADQRSWRCGLTALLGCRCQNALIRSRTQTRCVHRTHRLTILSLARTQIEAPVHMSVLRAHQLKCIDCRKQNRLRRFVYSEQR